VSAISCTISTGLMAQERRAMVNFRDALKAANAGFGKEKEAAPFEANSKSAAPPEAKAASGGKPAWLQAVSIEEGLPEKPKTSNENTVPRIWIPPNGSKTLLFLSPGQPIFPVKEHQVKLGGRWQNWATCLQMIGEPCPLCEAAQEYSMFYAYDAAYFTVIDVEGFTRKSGEKVEMIKSLLCAKSSTLPLIKRRYSQRAEKGETLRGALMEVYRKDDPKSPAVGDVYDFSQMVDLSELTDSEEYDLSVVLAPDPELVQNMADRLKMERAGTSTKPVKF
jgi:hypothetical protein